MKTKYLKVKEKTEKKNLVDFTKALEKGEIIAIPTETVYGLACNALNEKAQEKIYELKGRPKNKALSLHIGRKEEALKYGKNISKETLRLMEEFWPGPLTIILEKDNNLPDFVTQGLTTIAFRYPDHPISLEFLRACPFPVVATSANLSGQKSSVTGQEILNDFDGKIYGIIDSERTTFQKESTIIDGRKIPFKILREGHYKKEDFLEKNFEMKES